MQMDVRRRSKGYQMASDDLCTGASLLPVGLAALGRGVIISIMIQMFV